jgi:hypothetical protein
MCQASCHDLVGLSSPLFNKAITMKPDDITRIFDDDYQPPWQLEAERAVRKSLEEAVTIAVEFNYRKNAYETLRRIALSIGSRDMETRTTRLDLSLVLFSTLAYYRSSFWLLTNPTAVQRKTTPFEVAGF